MAISTINLLPIRFKPEPDELFSSWLVRLAMAHGLKLHVFTKFIFPKRRVWNRDIDKSADAAHIEAACKYTNVSEQRIFNSTLVSFEGNLYETHNPNGIQMWLMPVGVFRQTRTRFGLQMCPLCLSEDKTPYYRRLWRVSWSVVCTKHKIRLLDRCPGCQHPIIFHRGDMGWRGQAVSTSMTQCSDCGLYWTSKKVINGLIQADADAADFQIRLENASVDRHIEVGGFGYVHSINFFNGLKHILRILSVSRRTPKFRKTASEKSGLPLGETSFDGRQFQSFEYLPAESRYRTIRLASWLLDKWSERFVETALETDTFSSALLPYDQTAPFWYQLPVDQYLSRRTHPVSEEEILSALGVLENRKTFLLAKDLERLMGRRIFAHTPDKFTVSVYERMKKLNEVKEKERLRGERIKAQEIEKNRNGCSKTKALQLARLYRRRHLKPPKRFNKTQSMFDALIDKYKRRERLKMAKRMDKAQNSRVVGEEFGVSPGIVMKWYRRYKKDGVEGLSDRSRAPQSFQHQIIFEKQEKWIRTIHAEGLQLAEMQKELRKRFDFEITDGGLYRALNRLKLVLPCSKRNVFKKRNRRKAADRRQMPQKKIFAAQEKWILNLHGEGFNNSQIKRELKSRYDFSIGIGTVREILLKNNLNFQNRQKMGEK